MNDKVCRSFEEINAGDTASVEVVLTQESILEFAKLSGDYNPIHTDKSHAQRKGFPDTIAHGLWSGVIISAVLGTKLPGPGTVYISQSLNFKRPIFVGDTVVASVTVKSKNEKRRTIIVDCLCVNQKGEITTIGEAEVLPPRAS